MEKLRGYGPAVLLRDMRADMARADGRTSRLVGSTGRLVRQVGVTAFMNAVQTEGPEVATAAGEGYWRDMDRRYPWIAAERVFPGGGMLTRWGRVKERTVYGRMGLRRVQVGRG